MVPTATCRGLPVLLLLLAAVVWLPKVMSQSESSGVPEPCEDRFPHCAMYLEDCEYMGRECPVTCGVCQLGSNGRMATPGPIENLDSSNVGEEGPLAGSEFTEDIVPSYEVLYERMRNKALTESQQQVDGRQASGRHQADGSQTTGETQRAEARSDDSRNIEYVDTNFGDIQPRRYDDVATSFINGFEVSKRHRQDEYDEYARRATNSFPEGAASEAIGDVSLDSLTTVLNEGGDSIDRSGLPGGVTMIYPHEMREIQSIIEEYREQNTNQEGREGENIDKVVEKIVRFFSAGEDSGFVDRFYRLLTNDPTADGHDGDEEARLIDAIVSYQENE